MNSFQESIFRQRYSLGGRESWEDTCNRVASALARVEVQDSDLWRKRFKRVMVSGLFIPAGRVLKNAGLSKPTMLNCFALDVNDDVSSIGRMLNEVYVISCSQGGVGINFSRIRPMGDTLRGEDATAPGSISNIEMVDTIGRYIKAGGSRRVALLAGLSVHHPDLLYFLKRKLNVDVLNNFNVSVLIDNEFLKAVEEDKEWVFQFSGRSWYFYVVKFEGGREEGVVARDEEHAKAIAENYFRKSYSEEVKRVQRQEVRAGKLLRTIVEHAWECGEPGILNIDLMNKYNNTSYYEEVVITNPCGEICLPNHGSCCLGSVNLSEMWDEKAGKVDWIKFSLAIQVGVRMLDNVLTVNKYPLFEVKEVSQRSRRIGLGVVGLAHLLIKTGIIYGSDECLEFVDELFKRFKNESYKESVELAREKGTFPGFERAKYVKQPFIQQLAPTILNGIKNHGVRNCSVNSLAPTGTISMVCGTSSSIEPIYAPFYIRRHLKAGTMCETNVVDGLFEKHLREGKDLSCFVGAMDVTPEQHIAMQATIQKHIDLSISKTINLPGDYDVGALYDNIRQYIEYCKGFTIYREGSRGEEPLQAIPIKGMKPQQIEKLIKKKSIVVGAAGKACVKGTCEL